MRKLETQKTARLAKKKKLQRTTKSHLGINSESEAQESTRSALWGEWSNTED